MKFNVNKLPFLKELQYVIGAVDKRSAVPCLSNLLLEAHHDGLTIKGTDLDLAIITRCAAEVVKEGKVCLNAKKLLEIVKALPEAEINITIEGDQGILRCERSRFKLQTLPLEQYPEIAIFQGTLINLPTKTFGRFISQTLIAVSAEESRYHLNGVKCEISATSLKMIATDGHRLSFVSAIGDFGEGTTVDVIIPKKAVTELARLCAEPVETFGFGLTENHLFFQIGDRHLISRLLTGQFPNYELVLPTGNHNKLRVNRAQMRDALKRVALMADERSHAIKLDLGPGRIQISSQAANCGEAGDELVLDDYQGDALIAGFNANYLQDCFNVMTSDEVSIELKDANSQIQILPVSEGPEIFRYVIMPMKL